MIVIEGSVRLPAGGLDRARSAIETMVTASRAEVGCDEYAFAVDLLDPTLIRIVERWESRAALAAHFESEHMAAWRAAAADLGVSDRSLRLYEADPEPM